MSAIVPLLLALVAVGCGADPEPVAGGGPEATEVTDCAGEPVTFDTPPERVVTLDGNAAVYLHGLGLADRIVGTGYTVPFATEEPAVRAELEEIPVLNEVFPSKEQVAGAQPDFVVTAYASALNGAMGSPSSEDVTTMGAKSYGACAQGPRAADVGADLSTGYEFIRDLGKIFGVTDRAEELVAELEERERALVETYQDQESVRVLALTSPPQAGQPMFVYTGGYVPNALITLAGGRNLFADVDAPMAEVSYEQVVERDPEAIWVLTGIMTADGASAEQVVAAIKEDPLLGDTTAARQDRFVLTPEPIAGALSLRNLDAVEALATGIHPASR